MFQPASLRPLRAAQGIALSVVLALLLGGCLGGSGAKAKSDGELHGVFTAEFEGEGGLVSGIVTDEDELPIVGAQVSLDRVGQVVIGRSGGFTFQNVPPGDYRIEGLAVGYASVSRTISVIAGQTTESHLRLAASPHQDPFHEILVLGGHVCLQTYVADVHLTYGNYLCEDDGGVVVPFDARPGLVTLVSEMDWRATSAVTSDHLRLDVWQGGSRSGAWSCDHCYGYALGPSPVYLRMEGPFEGVESNEGPSRVDNLIRLPASGSNPGGVNVVFDQRVTIYTSLFYGSKPADGFTARPDE